jgi:thiol-disulfide isomerase/thioredoxin
MFSIEYIGATWCTSCKTIKPLLESLAKRFQVKIVIKDLDEDCTEEERAEITKVPTVIMKKDGNPVATYNVNQVQSVDTWLKENVAITSDDSF